MRIKALVKFNLSGIRNAVIIFYLCYMGAILLSSVINTVVSDNTTVVFGVSGELNGASQTWSSGIFTFAIFMLVSSLICSQNGTKFLITRSVSRKEIFIANALFMCALSVIMSVLQIIGIYIDGLVRWCLGADWRGLDLDIQSKQAPDMNNPLVFFVVSFSILLAFGALSYLYGSLMARWKAQTLIASTMLFVLLLALIGGTDMLTTIIKAFNTMFLDDSTGLIIMLKQIAFAVLVTAISFPIMRKVTAAKQ